MPNSVFISDDFLLENRVASRLYHDVARELPLYDYHSHLPVGEIAANRPFEHATGLWLAGDHMKWRAMRTHGITEARITGAASAKDKFQAWCETVPYTLGNPLYHWSHLELKRLFGIDQLICGERAPQLWDAINEQLPLPEKSPIGLLGGLNVALVGTTDDPLSPLTDHHVLRDRELSFTVEPTFRADRLYKVDLPDFADYLTRLASVTATEIATLEQYWHAILLRLDHFAAAGCHMADHGMEHVSWQVMSEKALSAAFVRLCQGRPLTIEETEGLRTELQLRLAREYQRRGWVMQLHLGVLINGNQRQFNTLGANCGFDCIDDRPLIRPLLGVLGQLEAEQALPKTILYGLNPANQPLLAALTGVFQDGSVAGKIQLGAAWWFNDQQDGIEHHLRQVANIGLLSHFVGMVTDSRSFMSGTRHEYFRRILCNQVGHWVAQGVWPDERSLHERFIRDLCFENAVRYFSSTETSTVRGTSI